MTSITRPSIVEATAQAVYEATRAYCAGIGEPFWKPWSEIPEVRKDAYRNGVGLVLLGSTRTLGRPVDEEDMHERWRVQRVAQGWMRGPYSEENRTHPNLCPFTELRADQRGKLEIFVAVARAVGQALRASEFELATRVG